MTKHQQIRKIGSYNSDIMNNLKQIIQNSTRTSQSTTTELMTTFRMNQNLAMYQTLPITPGTMNCTSLSMWITNQTTTGFCAPGGIVTQIRRSPTGSGYTESMGPLTPFAPGTGVSKMGGRRRKQTKKRRRYKTKRKRYRKKRVRNKNKRRTRKNKKTKRSR